MSSLKQIKKMSVKSSILISDWEDLLVSKLATFGVVMNFIAHFQERLMKILQGERGLKIK